MLMPRWRTVRAAIHETRCVQCRVSWRSWWLRLIGVRLGYTPGAVPGPREQIQWMRRYVHRAYGR